MPSLTAPAIALIPLTSLLLSALWGVGAAIHPGMMPGRGVAALLVVGCLLVALRPVIQWSWRNPALWAAAASLWQIIAWLGWGAVNEPGFLWWGERAAALIGAVGVAAWCAGQPHERLLQAVACAGAGTLLINAGSQVFGAGSWLPGPDAPFGNVNFNVGGGTALLGVLAAAPRPLNRTWIIAGVGAAAALILGTPTVSGNACRAVWPTVGAMIGLVLILRLPRRWHAPLVIVGEIAVLGLFVALLSGMVALPNGVSPSTGYRIGLWRAAVEAIAAHPVIGTGPASAIQVLQEQPSSSIAWLWLPSYGEHAHNEYFNAAVEGGLVQVLLLAAAVIATIAPLWKRRDEAVCRGLLVAWAGVLTNALVESHLSQPGPLVLLAALAGVTWAVTIPASGLRTVPGPWLRVPAMLFALLLTVQCGRDFIDGGAAPMIEFRAHREMTMASGDPLRIAEIASETRSRIGYLDTWITIEAVWWARALQPDRALPLVLLQLHRLPVDPEALDLSLRLRERAVRIHDQTVVERIDQALAYAIPVATWALDSVPANAKNEKARERLKSILERAARLIGPTPSAIPSAAASGAAVAPIQRQP